MGIIYDIEEGEGMETTHKYEEDGTSDCAYGCGAWMGGFASGAPDGIDPFGECPNAPAGIRTCAYCHISYPATQSHEDAEDCREALLVRVAELEQERADLKSTLAQEYILSHGDKAMQHVAYHNWELDMAIRIRDERIAQLKERAEAAEAKATEYSQAYTSAAEKGNNHISEIEALTAANLALTGEVEILRTEMTKLELEKEKL